MRALALIVLALMLLAPALRAQEAPAKPTSPKAAWEAFQKELMDLRQARNHAAYRALQAERPKEFLEAWEKSGAKAEGEERHYLGQFLAMAKRNADAMKVFRSCVRDESLTAGLRDESRIGFAATLNAAVSANELAVEEARAALEECGSLIDGCDKPETKAIIHRLMGYALSGLGSHEATIEHFLEAARAQPALASAMARSVFGELMGNTWDLAAYDGLRERGGKLAKELTALQEKHVAALREAGDTRAISRAESALARIAGMTKPLEMLGRPAPAWTLVKAYGKTKAIEDHRGEVVMLDFWATWCGWCIKSFPAMRDVLEGYQGQDFVIVGVTAPANNVTESRYDLDDDLKAKGEGKPKSEYLRFPA